MKKILIVLLMIIITVHCIGCSKTEAVQTRVVLDWTPNTNHTGLYVALEKGWYKDAGLDVTLLQPPEDGALSLVAAGKAEFGVDFQEYMAPAIASAEPRPVVAVAAILAHNTSGIVSLKEKGITSPKELAGKRFSTGNFPLTEAMVRTVMEADGGNFDEVEKVPVSVYDVISALEADLDAVWIYRGWDGVALELAGVETNYFAFADIDPVFDYYTPVLITNTDYAQKNPEAVKKFLAATTQGYEFAIQNPDEAAEILLKHAPELSPELVKASQSYLAGQYQAGGAKWGEIDANRWNRFYAWMYAQGLLEHDITGKGFTNEYLPG